MIDMNMPRAAQHITCNWLDVDAVVLYIMPFFYLGNASMLS